MHILTYSLMKQGRYLLLIKKNTIVSILTNILSKKKTGQPMRKTGPSPVRV